MRYEPVEGSLADEPFKVIQEVVTLQELTVVPHGDGETNLLIRNATECIIGIFAFEIDDKLCKFVIMAKPINCILCSSLSI